MRVLIPLCLQLSLAVSVAGEPLTADALWSMERVGAPAISPDGEQVVFPVTSWSLEDGKSNSDLWLVPTDGSAAPRRLTYNPGSDSGPRWSPDGRSILFRSKRGDGPAQLYRLPLDGGEAVALTELPVAPRAPRWFPDGKRIAFLVSTWPDLDDDWEAVEARIEERKESKANFEATETRLLRYWDHYLTDGRRTHLCVLDLESGEVTDLMPSEERLLPFWGDGGSFDVAPDGKELAFAVNTTAPPWQSLNFDLMTATFDPEQGLGEWRNRTADNPASDGSPLYTPDGRSILFTKNRRAGIAPDFTRLARLDRGSGSIELLADALDAQPRGVTIAPEGRHAYFHAQDHGKTHIYRVPIAGGTVERVVTGGTTGAVDVGPGGRLVYQVESITAPVDLHARIDGASRPITAFNVERLAELDLGRVEDVRYEGANGDEVQMFVVYPPGFDPAKKWPLLLLVHGGPHGAWRDAFHYRWNAALFAAPGYVTLAVNFHGSTGSGQAFAESILGNHAELPFEDLMKAVDHVVDQGSVDTERMAAAGGSYGGYMVSWILGHTDRFAALVNHAGVYDLMAQFASDWTWSRPNNYGAAPWTDPERIDRYSPSRFAKNFSTPTLTLHGEKDYRVPYTQGVNLHGVLTGKGVPSRLVIFPDENHWILKPHNARIWWDEVHGWLDRWIGAGADD